MFESRDFLSVAPVAPGFYHQDPNTGEWSATRYNGSEYVREAIPYAMLTDAWETPLVADLTGDDRDEILTRDSTTGNWFATNWDGATYSTVSATNWNPEFTYTNYLIGDVTGDGRTDLVARASYGGWWTLSYNGDSYTNVAFGYSSPDVEWQHIALADLTGDDILDLVARNASSGDWMAIRWNGQQASFTTIAHWSTERTYQDVRVADLYGDDNEAIIGRDDLGNWRAIHFDGTSFQTEIVANWDSSVVWSNVLVGDLTGDGRDEILGRDPTTGTWWIVEHRAGRFQSRAITNWNPQFSFTHVQIGDLEGDGTDEILGWASDGGWWAVDNFGASFGNRYLGHWSTSTDWQYVAVVEFSGDGVADLIGFDPGLNLWRRTSFDGDRYTAANSSFAMPVIGAVQRLFADLNGNGQEELLQWFDVDGSWRSAELTSTGEFTHEIVTSLPRERPIFVDPDIFDIDGDGVNEVIAFDAAQGDWWMLKSGQSSVSAYWLVSGHSGAAWEDHLHGDIDGDGTTDFVARDANSGDWWMLRWTGSSFETTRLTNWNLQYTYSDVQLLDLDGDGCEEIVGWASYGTWWAVSWNDAHPENVLLGFWNRNLTWANVVAVDINLDGRSDLVAYCAETGQWNAIRYNGSQFTSQIVAYWGARIVRVDARAGDFDGDGRNELISRGLGSGQWSILRPVANGYVRTSASTWAASAKWQNVVVGDFNGDGRDEVVGQDQATGSWMRTASQGAGYAAAPIAVTGIASFAQAAALQHGAHKQIAWRDMATESWHVLAQGETVFSDRSLPSVQSDAEIGSFDHSDASLRSRVLSEISELRVALESDPLEAASLLLVWSSNAVNYAMTSNVLNSSRNGLTSASAARMFDIWFEPNLGGGYCGNVAQFYARVLDLFEIPNILFDFGAATGPLTHATVIVPIWSDSQWRYFIFDPIFNATFHDLNTAERVDLLQMLDARASGTLENVGWQTGELDGRDWVSDAEWIGPEYVARGVVGQKYVYGRPDYSLQVYFDTFRNELVGLGFSADLTGFVQLMSAGIWRIHSNLQPTLAANLAAELQSRSIEMH